MTGRKRYSNNGVIRFGATCLEHSLRLHGFRSSPAHQAPCHPPLCWGILSVESGTPGAVCTIRVHAISGSFLKLLGDTVIMKSL